jgi:4-hydroxy-2-oxoheptanedioate aldolase
VESQKGLESMNEFIGIQTLDGPGVDGLIIGPHDLSTSYGMPEQYRSQAFLDLSCGIIKKARSMGVAVGGHTGFRDSLDLQVAWAKAGANIILHCSDAYLSANQLNNDLNAVKKCIGEQEHLNTNAESI